MNETMGQIIRRLRKEKELTQEELAELIGVTAQAVSKWESNTGMPDISQVVPLAMVFDVPTDVLFGRYGKSDEDAANQLADEIGQKTNRWFDTNEEECAVMEEQRECFMKALKKYPSNTKLRMGVVTTSHFLATQGRSMMTDERRKSLLDESTASAEIIVKYSPVQDDVLRAKWWIMNNYIEQKDWTKAIAIAESMPRSLDKMRVPCLAQVRRAEGNLEEYYALRCQNIAILLGELQYQASDLQRYYMKQGQAEDVVHLGEFLRGLLPLIYGKETYVPPFHSNVEHLFLYPACSLMKLGRQDEALDWLEAGLEYENEQAKYYNTKETVDAPLLRGCKFRFYGKEYSRQLRAEFEDVRKVFTPLSGNPRYEKFLENPINPANIAE